MRKCGTMLDGTTPGLTPHNRNLHRRTTLRTVASVIFFRSRFTLTLGGRVLVMVGKLQGADYCNSRSVGRSIVHGQLFGPGGLIELLEYDCSVGALHAMTVFGTASMMIPFNKQNKIIDPSFNVQKVAVLFV